MVEAPCDPEELWARLRPDAAGLVPAIIQHADSGRVLMLGYMNKAALAATCARGRVTFWSRSRRALWEKGETSGHTLETRGLRYDCDADALLVLARPRGPTCHTGRESCFFHGVAPEGDDPPPHPGDTAALSQLGALIEERKAGRGATNSEGRSYVRTLMDRGVPKLVAKIEEEAGELCEALADDDDAHVAEEAADLLFHVLVALAHRDQGLADVTAVLRRRLGVSGVDEKASRG